MKSERLTVSVRVTMIIVLLSLSYYDHHCLLLPPCSADDTPN